MLGSDVLSVRLGGIYALQRLAQDEPDQYYVPIVRVLNAFALDPTKQGAEELLVSDSGGNVRGRRCGEDVQEAVRAIGMRSAADIEREDQAAYVIGLIGVNLAKASLHGVNLTGVFLSTGDLTGASLAVSNLTGANLSGAKLRGTMLRSTNLSGAILSAVQGLTQSQLDEACADPENPPKLDGVHDARTGVPLQWREKPCD